MSRTTYNPYCGDSYDTPEDTPTSLWHKLLLGSRLSFYIRNFYVFIRSGLLAKYTDFSEAIQVKYSLKNFAITESCGGRIHLRGLDNLSKVKGPAVIIGNHMSLLETALFHAFMRPRREFCFVIKEQLFNVPFFGDIMRKLGCIAVSRKNSRGDLKAVLEKGKERLDAGVSVIVFPQGSRSAVFDRAHFNTVGVKLARYASVPVIPMALRTDFIENGKLIKDLGPINNSHPVWFEFGEPLTITGSGKEEQKKVIEFIESRLKSWGTTVVEHDDETHHEQEEK